MSVNLPVQSASLPFQDLAGQTVAIDKRRTVKQDLSNNYQSASSYQTSPFRLAIQFAFFTQPVTSVSCHKGASVCKLSFPLKSITRLPVFKTQAMGKISVNQTRGHRCYKWLCGSVRSSLSPVLTLFFWLNLPAQNLGCPRG